MTSLPTAAVFDDPLGTTAWLDEWVIPLLAVLSEMLGGGAATELTIASGTITPTRAIHAVDTEADAANDDLSNISLTTQEDGRILILFAANGGRTVRLKHSAGGSGQMMLAGAADYDLDETSKTIVLRRDGTQWVEVALNPGSPAAWRSYLGLAIGTSVQAYNALLAAIAALGSNGFVARTSSSAATARTITAGALIAVTNGDGSAGNPTIAITDAELVALAGLVSAANKLPYFTGSGSAALADFTSAARTLLTATDAAGQRTAMGVKSMATRDVTIGTGAPSGGADGDVHLRYA